MARKRIPTKLPTRQEIERYIAESERPPTRKDIARAFGVRRHEQEKLDVLLSEMDSPGSKRGRNKSAPSPKTARGHLPEVCAVEIIDINEDGEAVARPLPWEDAKREPPYIVLMETDKASPALGERALVRLARDGRKGYRAQLIRILPDHAVSQRVLGIVSQTKEGFLLEPVSRKDKQVYKFSTQDANGAQPGELALAELIPARHRGYGAKPVKIMERLGSMDSPRAASMVAIHKHEIPTRFSAEAVHQAENAPPPVIAPGRVDLRDYALVTIDGEDARDFDDAVWAEPDTDPNNEGGWHLLVAIADVAHYVHVDDALDKEAFLRGNSVYFPDRVVPMLPEALSNGLCSLRPDEDRFCIAVHLWISAEGETRRYKFVRGLMRSRARLTYTQVQAMQDRPEGNLPQQETVAPLYGAYQSLRRYREKRGTLELELPEFKVALDSEGKVTSIGQRERLDSHRLIEEFMIAANVAAAHALGKARIPAIYRVHETPDAAKLQDLKPFLESLGYGFNISQAPKAEHFNRILLKSRGTPESPMINNVILRSQMQAYYSPHNKGHFGLALQEYTHFTSPIRRYSDLIVHRALITLLKLDVDDREGMTPQQASKLPFVADHISMTERRAMMAERDATDRYIVAYMKDRVGASFRGTIGSVNSFGMFVTLNDTGASGFVPLSLLGDDFYQFNKQHASLTGRRTGTRITMGQSVEVELAEANSITGSLLFRLLAMEESKVKRRPVKAGKDVSYRKIKSKRTSGPPGKKRR